MKTSDNKTPPDGARLLVRTAAPEDYEAIRSIARELELEYPSMNLAIFHVGELGGRVVAIAELKKYDRFCLLSCVGVRAELQGSGLGKRFVDRVLQHAAGDVYLYTLVPGFFSRCGFTEVPLPPAFVPGRRLYGCAECDPSRCLCMVRKTDVSRLS